jgi:hypothetical protein
MYIFICKSILDNILDFLKIFLLPMPLFLLSTHKQCILGHFIQNITDMFPPKPYTLAGMVLHF